MKNYLYAVLFFIFLHPQANAKWYYASELVGIDDFIKYTVTTNRIISKSKDMPYRGKDNATLTITNNPDEKQITISIFYSKGYTICGQPRVICRLKFDNEPSFSVNFINANNKENSIIFIEPSEVDNILEKILNHEIMKVEIKYPISPPDYIEFNIAGLDRTKVTLPDFAPGDPRNGDPRNPNNSPFFSPYFGNEDNNNESELNQNDSKPSPTTQKTDSEKYESFRKSWEAKEAIKKESFRKYWEAKEATKKELSEPTGINAPYCKIWPDNSIVKVDSKIRATTSPNHPPKYPLPSQRKREQGDVQVKFVVTSTGNTDKHEIISSSGFKKLDEATIDAIKLWKFSPAVLDGKSLDCWATQNFNFRLRLD